MSFNQILKKKKQSIKNTFKESLKDLDKNYKIHYAAYLIEKKWNEISDGASQLTLSTYGASLWLYLDETQNVTKDVMLFVEEIQGIAKGVTGVDYITSSNSSSVDFKWSSRFDSSLNLYFYYASGKCERKLIRTETKIIEEPVYELICN